MSIKTVKNGAQWTVREGYENILDKINLDDFHSMLNGKPYKLIKETKVRSVISIPGSEISDGGIYIKYFKRKSYSDYVKYLFAPTRTRTEWKIANELLSKDINTVLPLAIAEKRTCSLLVTEAVSKSEPLIEYCQTNFDGVLSEKKMAEKKELLHRLAGFIRNIHEKGFFHYDLHAGNILIKFKNNQSSSTHDYVFYLMDLHRVKILKRMSCRKRLHNLAQIFNSLSSILTKSDKLDFLRSYGLNALSNITDEGELVRQIESQSSRIRNIHYRSRLKRCLKESSAFSKKRSTGMKIFFRKGYDTGSFQELIEKHHNALVSGDKAIVMKRDTKTALTRFPLENEKIQSVVVKKYKVSCGMCLIKNIFRNSAGRKAWIAGNGLLVYGFNTPEPLALMEKKVLGITTDSYLIMEDVKDSLEMDRYILKNFHNQLKSTQFKEKNHPKSPPLQGGERGEVNNFNITPLDTDQLRQSSIEKIEKRRTFINDFAKTIGKMHNQNIFHSDLKTCNIMVKEKAKSFDFTFLDFDKVSFNEQITTHKRIKNLTQINLSTPRFISTTDRLRFLKEYLSACNAQAGLKQYSIINEKKSILREIVNFSKTEKILYVSFKGDVTEDW
ncbi:MAG: protein kinase [Candidatus Scalindua rubra]|uniref:Protein kinase n=1 Tax=Candidatus Scalindua rubra TaxID=1872076 RepID=A0A1E3X3Y0_9BACT|nr:MAG: protein kinase [Candidatus Scalindua rubra]